MRVESQADTIYGLALAWELFHVDYDNTSIDQKTLVTEIHQPDGKPDVLQQLEHGVLSVVGGYESLGRLYRGIIEPTLRQYVFLGDGALMTDNVVFDPKKTPEGSRARRGFAGVARRSLGIHRGKSAARTADRGRAGRGVTRACVATTTTSRRVR